MEYNQLWALFWKCMATAVAVVAMSIAGCSAHKDAKVAEMVTAGASPIEAACAVGRDGYQMVCVLRAVKAQ